MNALSVLAHHSEPTDPVLLRWLTDSIDAILGLGPATIVLLIALPVVAFPVAIAFFAVRGRRRET